MNNNDEPELVGEVRGVSHQIRVLAERIMRLDKQLAVIDATGTKGLHEVRRTLVELHERLSASALLAHRLEILIADTKELTKRVDRLDRIESERFGSTEALAGQAKRMTLIITIAAGMASAIGSFLGWMFHRAP